MAETERKTMNEKQIVPVMAVAIINGIFSPYVLFVFITYWLWYPFFLPTMPQAVYIASALVLSTLTLMVSGIPAALYERMAKNPDPLVTGIIWLAGAMALTLPAVPNVLRALGAG